MYLNKYFSYSYRKKQFYYENYPDKRVDLIKKSLLDYIELNAYHKSANKTLNYKQHIISLSRLGKNNISDIYTIFNSSIKNNYTSITKYIIRQYALKWSFQIKILEWITRKGYLLMIKLLFNYYQKIIYRDNMLICASEYGHLNIVKYVIKLGADIHVNNNLSICYAAEKGYLYIVKYLIKCGANIHVNNEYALQKACYSRYLSIVELLLKNGADIHTNNDNALRSAVYYEQIDLIKLLIKYGANFHANHDEVFKYLKENSLIKN